MFDKIESTRAATISGSADAEVLNGTNEDDRLSGLGGADTITSGIGDDTIAFEGDPFDGADVSAEGRQIIGNEDFLTDFTIGVPILEIEVNDAATTSEVLAEAVAGNIYYNLHSSDFPAGEVRGQLTLVSDDRDENGYGDVTFTSILNGDNEVQDPAVETDAEGTATITFTVANNGDVTYSTSIEVADFDEDRLTVGHLHNAPEGENGPVVVDLLADAGVDGSIGNSFGVPTVEITVDEADTTSDVLSEAVDGNIYFNIHSTDFPSGELRGQLELVSDDRDANGYGTVSFRADLSGDAEVPAVDTDARGFATITFDVAVNGDVTYTTSIELEDFNEARLTVGHLHNAPEGENGGVVVDILADARANGSIEGDTNIDVYSLNAADFGIEGDVNFAAVDLSSDFAEIPEGANVIILLNTDNDDDSETPFLAGTAQGQIAELIDEPGPGVFVYLNSNLGVNRLVYSSDLSDAAADLSIISRHTDLSGDDAADALADFSADNFVFTDISVTGDNTAEAIGGTTGDDTIIGSQGDDTINGGDGDDFLIGARDNDVINGGDGNDEVRGGRGDDVLDGGAGNDLLFGSLGDDVLNGGARGDVLRGDDGADTLNGGGGADRVDYVRDDADIFVDLQTGEARGGFAEGDTLINVESVTTGTGDDTLWALDTGSRLSAAGGDDKLYGRGGDDTLAGGNGNDTLYGSEGADVLNGGRGVDEADFRMSDAGVQIDLAAGTAAGGYAEGDTLLRINNLDGSAFDDELTGNQQANWLRGNAGDDTLTGGARADTFVFGEGSGDDVITDYDRDWLDLSTTATDFTSLEDVLAAATETADGLLIDLGAGDSVLLQGVEAQDLSSEYLIL